MNQQSDKLQLRVTRAMVRLGIPMGTAGWDYLREVILLRCGETLPEGELYARTAEKCGVSIPAVRNGCRNAVRRTYESGRAGMPDGFFSDGAPLSCGDFIARFAELIARGEL